MKKAKVLILVLLDVPIGVNKVKSKSVTHTWVLILVLLDVPIGVGENKMKNKEILGLNPCFTGCSYRSGRNFQNVK